MSAQQKSVRAFVQKFSRHRDLRTVSVDNDRQDFAGAAAASWRGRRD